MSVYNGEKYLQEAINSILNQTFADFEFIIIDDASTDKTHEILENFKEKDSRILIINKEKNIGSKGFIENLNIGLKNAKGKLIARMDADDISNPERFQKQLDFLNKNENIFMVGSSLQLIDENGFETKLLPTFSEDKDIQKNMFKNIAMYHPVIFFRNNRKIFYREKMQFCEDYDLFFRLMTDNYKFGNIDKPLLKYRILKDSESRKGNKIIRWLFVEKAREFYLERLKTGKDSYDSFEPETILNILKLDFKNTLNDLLTASKIAIKYQDFESLRIILEKGIAHFPKEKRFKLYSKIPKSLLLILNKIF